MFSDGCMGDDRLVSTRGLDFMDAEFVSFESFPGLGSAQIELQLVCCCLGHRSVAFYLAH